MSQAELQRVLAAAAADPALAQHWRGIGNATDLAAHLRTAGYGVSDAEAASYLEGAAEALADGALDGVAGAGIAAHFNLRTGQRW